MPKQTENKFDASGVGFTTAMKIKRRMIHEGTRRLTVKCPLCGEWLHAGLAGQKDNLRLKCETKDCLEVME